MFLKTNLVANSLARCRPWRLKIFDKVNPKSFRCRGQKQFLFSFCIALIEQKIY